MNIRPRIIEAVAANPGLPDHMLARKVAADVGEEALVLLATEQIERVIATERRRRIREIENASAEFDPVGNPAKWQAVDALLDEYRRAVIVEWTSELLSAEFATGDGRRVTWGEATIEQHVARIRLLTQNVRGNLDAIARHEAAIATITNSDADNLDEAVRRQR